MGRVFVSIYNEEIAKFLYTQEEEEEQEVVVVVVVVNIKRKKKSSVYKNYKLVVLWFMNFVCQNY